MTKSPSFDPTIVDAALASYSKLIEDALKSPERGRWIIISKLARMAGNLDAVVGVRKRAADFDHDRALMQENAQASVYEPDDMIVGNELFNPPGMQGLGRIGVAGGEQMEMVRQMIDGFSGAQQATKPLHPVYELDVLLNVKQKSVDMHESTKEIDERIETLRKELNHAVVSANVLRGHQTQKSLGQGDLGVVGEADRHREEGDVGVDGEGRRQEMDR